MGKTQRTIQILAPAVLAAVLFSAGFMAVLHSLPQDVWEDWRPATCVSGGCFCEPADTASAVRQPVNAWSSFAFVLAGFMIIGLALFSAKGKERRLTAPYACMLGIFAVVTGTGSAFYHSSLTFIGQFFDILGMYLTATLMLVYAWERSFRWPFRRSAAVFCLLNALLIPVQAAAPGTRRYVFGVLVIAALSFETVYLRIGRPKIELRYLAASTAVFALAYAAWVLDNTGIICMPGSILQGHAVWHLLGAAAVGLLYRYYAGEKREES